MSLILQRHRLRSFTTYFVSRFLAVFILSSLAVTLLPIVSTSAEQSSMPCCAGKSAEHCDAGVTAPKPRPVITEPMCGLESIGLTWTPPSNEATVTLVADPVAIESASIEQDCQMDCGACATVPSRHKRQKSLTQARAAHHTPSTTTLHVENVTSAYSSNENWTRINPRGPPAVL